MGITRAVAPAISQNGSHIAFASTTIQLGTNADGNSEIFLYRNPNLLQITHTMADERADRITDGNFRPSISDDGRYIAFSSNRDLIGENIDLKLEIFICDTTAATVNQLTSTSDVTGCKRGEDQRQRECDCLHPRKQRRVATS